MTAAEILIQLKAMGSSNVQRIFDRHGVKDINYGVKIGDLKKIQKVVKKNHQLALELYETGVSDARYLAGLIADEKAVTKAELQHWLDTTESSSIFEYTIPWLAAESPYGWQLGKAWIASADEKKQTAG
ncbi:MAG: alkylation repair protein [Flaviaesturariibacter sp.]|nr:alkylation repair protein [Flaviaesturariibacter sp.]